MNDRLTQELYQTYPSIFASHCGFSHGDGWFGIINAMADAMSKIYSTYIEIDAARAIAWGAETYQGPHQDAQTYLMKVQPPQVIAMQVKEKLGTLRFYHRVEHDPRLQELAFGDNPQDDAVALADRYESFINGIIHMGEVLSAHTCEETGRPGELHVAGGKPHGWRRTLNREFAQTDIFYRIRGYVPYADINPQG